MFVEFECNGKPSGIKRTEADYYGFIWDEDKHITVDTKVLKDLIDKNKFSIRNGGDGRKSRGYLISKSRLLEVAC